MNANDTNPTQNGNEQGDTTPAINLNTAVQSLPLPRAENVFHDHLRGRYWVQDEQERWISYTREDLRLRLRSKLMLSGTPQDGLPAEVDDELDRIKQQQSVDAALPLAGYYAGLHRVLGAPVLVTTSPEPLQPAKGDHTRFQARLRRMFGPEQTDLFCGWLAYALVDYYEFLKQQTGRNVGMGLVIGGASGLGKSLLLQLLVQCFGGREAHPAQHATGRTSFNNDLIRAEVQVFDDEGMGDSYSARKEIGDFVKRTVAVESQRCHPKGKDAFPVKVFWRLIFCLNDEAENLQVLPPLERGVKDKLMMLKATGALLDEAEEHRPRQENWTMLLEEIACFIRWLVDDFEPDQTLLDSRFGMRWWHHPDLAEGVDSLAPEGRLLDMVLERTDLFDVEWNWRGTARELENRLKLEGSNNAREAHELLRNPTSTGKYLGKLAVKFPGIVVRAGRDKCKNNYCWKISLPDHKRPSAAIPT